MTAGGSDRDGRATGRDGAARDRDTSDRTRDVAAGERDGAAAERDEVAERREQMVRDQLWEQHRRAAERTARPQAGSSTDPVADHEQAQIDLEAAYSEAEMMRENVGHYLDDTAADRRKAEDDRRSSSLDRQRAGRNRDLSAADRQAAGLDRDSAAADRDQAEIERNLETPPHDRDA